MTSRALPPLLAIARDRLLEGVSRTELRQRASDLSHRYRSTAGAHARSSETLAYAVTRMPATYAAVTAVLDELRERAPHFAPQTLLDLGSGPGTVAWAAVGIFEGLKSVTAMEREAGFRDLADRLAADHPILSCADQQAVDLEQIPAIAGRFDLVTAAFSLAEIAPARLPDVVMNAWSATAGFLILIEPGTPEGFARILRARDVVIAAGGHVAAPCPHNDSCPLAAPDWCHFAVRLPRERDHRQVKGADAPFEDENLLMRFSAESRHYRFTGESCGRRGVSKIETTTALCTQEGLTQSRVPARDRAAYRQSKTWRWGDAIA